MTKYTHKKHTTHIHCNKKRNIENNLLTSTQEEQEKTVNKKRRES